MTGMSYIKEVREGMKSRSDNYRIPVYSIIVYPMTMWLRRDEELVKGPGLLSFLKK